VGALVLAHVFYHRPWSNAGLLGVALGAVLAAWNPQRNRQIGSAVEKFCTALLLGVPAWLIYFSQARFDERGLRRSGSVAYSGRNGSDFPDRSLFPAFPFVFRNRLRCMASFPVSLIRFDPDLARTASTGIIKARSGSHCWRPEWFKSRTIKLRLLREKSLY